MGQGLSVRFCRQFTALRAKNPRAGLFRGLSMMREALLVVLLSSAIAAPASAANADPFTGGSADAGAGKAAPCGACHGPGGNSVNPEWPKLAGQHSNYVLTQLKLLKSGERKNPLMNPQAATLSDEDMKNLAAFFAAQTPQPGVASPDAVKVAEKLYRAGDSKRGLPACSACHGPQGAGNAAAGYPRIGGQHAKYSAASLRRLRGTSGGSDANAVTMGAIAGKLTDNEIEALASYVNGLQ
jgi:cytochrome c553